VSVFPAGAWQAMRTCAGAEASSALPGRGLSCGEVRGDTMMVFFVTLLCMTLVSQCKIVFAVSPARSLCDTKVKKLLMALA